MCLGPATLQQKTTTTTFYIYELPYLLVLSFTHMYLSNNADSGHFSHTFIGVGKQLFFNHLNQTICHALTFAVSFVVKA